MSKSTSDLKRLIEWADGLGYEVLFEKNGGNNICFQTKTIEIDSSKKIKEKILILAHECGHIKSSSLRSAPHLKSNDKTKKKINRLWDEMMAWLEGKKILDDLKINYDKKTLATYAAKCLSNYINAFSESEEL